MSIVSYRTFTIETREDGCEYLSDLGGVDIDPSKKEDLDILREVETNPNVLLVPVSYDSNEFNEDLAFIQLKAREVVLFEAAVNEELEALVKDGLLEKVGSRYRLTPKGMEAKPVANPEPPVMENTETPQDCLDYIMDEVHASLRDHSVDVDDMRSIEKDVEIAIMEGLRSYLVRK